MGNKLVMRPAWKRFAKVCEGKLRTHDEDYGELGWKNCDPRWLLLCLQRFILKLNEAVMSGVTSSDIIAERAADVANLAMMIGDLMMDDMERRHVGFEFMPREEAKP